MNADSSYQRLGRLTPLGDILSLIDTRVSPVAPTKCPLMQARDFTLAEDVRTAAQPARAIALRDGFPVDSATVADAGSYAPVALPVTTQRIDCGDALPSGTDAVLPLDAVTQHGHRIEALAPVVAGEGVLPAGCDVAADTPLRRVSERVRAVDLAIMSAAGLTEVSIRSPKIQVVWGGEARSPAIGAALATIKRVAGEAGSVVTGKSIMLKWALLDPEVDSVIAVGGTGSGTRDRAVEMLARHGRVEAHGIALSPGKSGAFGFLGEKPVLLVPGRIDAALSIWLMIGRHLLARLAGSSVKDMPAMLPLKRKVTSTIGLTELIPVRVLDRMAEPLASGYLSFQSLSRSDGFIAIPAESEGCQAGAIVAVRSWP